MVSEELDQETRSQVAQKETQTPYSPMSEAAAPDVLAQLANTIAIHRVELLALFDQRGLHERALSARLFTQMNLPIEPKSLPGMFGMNHINTDGLVNINGVNIFAECKKVVENREYGFWHAVIQGILYRSKESTILTVCFIFDWGRTKGRALNSEEFIFLSRWTENGIRFVRLSLSDSRFIEHNLLGEWITIR